MKVLDYGCGWGTLLQVATSPGVSTFGFDATSWKRDSLTKSGVTICDTRDDLLANGPYDICICTSVLEHLVDPRQALDDIRTVLKLGGHALITCIVNNVALDSSWDKIAAMVDRGQALPYAINAWEHLNYFTPEVLTSFLGEFWFSPVKQPGRFVGHNHFALQAGLAALRSILWPILKPKATPWKYWHLTRSE